MDSSKFRFEAPPNALARWNPNIRAKAEDDGKESINIYSTVGEYGDGTGMTAKIMSAILRRAGDSDIIVNINSAGGDFFEGIAQYNLLKQHKGKVTVRVLGLAASAASVVAMAGDDIEIADSAFIMIHNAWTIAIGNKGDMRDVADRLQQFDESMIALYAVATGNDEKKIKAMMDAETYISGADAVKDGFAHAIIGQDGIVIDDEDDMEYNASAVRELDVALAKSGMPRSKRRELIKEIRSTPSAATTATPNAGLLGALQELSSKL
jgi:ATP-dependent protease ClpP protease subunit